MIDIQEILSNHAQWLRDPSTGKRANLSGADLSGACLNGAYMRDAILSGANLNGANLSGADLSDAILRNANLSDANLSGANLSGACLNGADLGGANLSYANLSGASLIDADLRGAEGISCADDARDRLVAAARAALAPGALEMENWHSCKTIHCLAGWAIHQAGPLGHLLEELCGPGVAGLYLLGPEAASHFHDSNEDARAYLQSVLDAEGEMHELMNEPA